MCFVLFVEDVLLTNRRIDSGVSVVASELSYTQIMTG